MVPIEAQFIDTCFYIKKEIFQPLFRALPAKKADIANHLFFPFFSSSNPTIYKCEWPSGQVDGLEFPMYGCTHGFDPTAVSADFVPDFFHRFFS